MFLRLPFHRPSVSPPLHHSTPQSLHPNFLPSHHHFVSPSHCFLFLHLCFSSSLRSCFHIYLCFISIRLVCCSVLYTLDFICTITSSPVKALSLNFSRSFINPTMLLYLLLLLKNWLNHNVVCFPSLQFLNVFNRPVRKMPRLVAHKTTYCTESKRIANMTKAAHRSISSICEDRQGRFVLQHRPLVSQPDRRGASVKLRPVR